jgi:hypothetical protein
LTTTSNPSPGLDENIGVQVIPGSKLSKELKSFLKTANLLDRGSIEAWTVVGSNTQINYSTHGVYRYFGKFPAPIAAELISQYTKKGDLVIDPAAGSGTTGVEALLLGRNAKLFDVNPLSVLIAKVKTRHLDNSVTARAIKRVETRMKSIQTERFDTTEIDLNHWFLPKTIVQLSKLKASIMMERRPELREFLLMCFASIVRKVSRATTQQGRLFLDVETAQTDVMPSFLKSANKAAERVHNLPTGSTVSVERRSLLGGDAKVGQKSKLVIYHPPYFNAYKYTSINSLEMAWLGFPRKETRSEEIREFFKIGKPENAEIYVQDMVESLVNIAKTVRKNGVVAMMIGDALLKGSHIDVTAQILDRVGSFYSVEKVVLRIPKYTEATWASSQRRSSKNLGITMYDFVVILRTR